MPWWRTVAAEGVALCLFPVILIVAVLCLPLLCCAEAVIRFRRRVRTRRAHGCCGGGRWRPEQGDSGDRTALLDRYLEDQLELVRVDYAGKEHELLVLLDPANTGHDKIKV